MKNKFSIAMSLAVILAMLLTSLALADDVHNDIVAVPEAITLQAGVASSYVDVQFYVQPTGGDSDGQCNFDSTSEKVTFTINVPSGVTANPSSLTFNKCHDGSVFNYQPVRFSAGASAISGNVTFTETFNNSGGSFDYDQAVFYVNVTTPPPSDTTGPVITSDVNGTLGNNGWYVSDVTVSWTVSDPESTVTSMTGCDTTNITTDTAGVTLTCSASSAGGNNSQSVTIKRDATAPTLSLAFTPDTSDGSNGWWKTSGGVPFAWICSDALSGIDSSFGNGCPSPLSGMVTDQGTTNFSDQVKDLAGNLSAVVNRDLKLDNVAPVVTVTAARGADKDGWYNAPVSFNTAGSDATSGVLDANCTADQNYTGPDGTGLTVGGSCTDNAGNIGTGSSAAFSFDDTNPGLTWNGGPADGSSHYFGFVPVAPTCTASDTTSGPDSCGVTGYGTTVGSHTMTATAYDVAGNSYSETRSYTVLAWTLNGFYQPVDMGSGVWNTVKNGSTVPLKFEVFAGSTELTDPSIVNQPLKATQTLCSGGTTDDIELLSSGSTILRYDATAGQFIYNWQTPRGKAGYCYVVTVTTADGSSITANFKLK